MGTHSLWLNLMISPEKLNQEFLDENKDDLFRLIVYLIYNGITCNQSNNNPEDLKRLQIIKFLLYKLLSYFDWDLIKIRSQLPPVHQEFSFTEFKKFCDHEENVQEKCRIFADLLFHRWIMLFEQECTYPGKNNFKVYNNNVNQSMMDTYYFPNDIQENLMKKTQNNCLCSINEIERYINKFENGNITEVAKPSFDCFHVDETTETKFFSEKAINMDMNSFLDELYFELARWNYIHEDYTKAYNYFIRIKDKTKFPNLEDYVYVTYSMTSKNYRITEPKTFDLNDKRLVKFFLNILEKSNESLSFCVKDYDLQGFEKVLENLYLECKNDDEKLYLYKRLSKYLFFKVKDLHESLDVKTKSFILDIENFNEQKEKFDNEITEEGEIYDDDENDEDCELMMIQASDPDTILGLIPSIRRSPSAFNTKWELGKYESIINSTMTKTDQQKSQLILAKANELRNGRFFKESRVLYLSLLEDIQASHPLLAEMIRLEILQTDLEKFFFQKPETSIIHDLKTRCREFLRDKQNYIYFPELVELICLFMLEYSCRIFQEFTNHPSAVVRFSSCLAHLSINFTPRDNKSKDFWEFCLVAFLKHDAKYVDINFYSISFCTSFTDFICKLKNNTDIINLVSTCLIKIYSIIKEHSPQHIVPNGYPYDLFPSSLPTNIITSIDANLLSKCIEQTLRTYVNLITKDTFILRFYAEFLMNQNRYSQAMKYLIEVVMITTKHFRHFDYLETKDQKNIIQQMIVCANKLNHHILAGVLYQFNANPDYGHAFKELSHNNYIDSPDDLYECIWDVTLLEFLINFHYRRGEEERKQKVIKLISQLDLNSNNNSIHLKEASNLRKAKLFRILAKQFLL